MNEKPSNKTLEEWKNNKSYWIWGFFYFNREDSRVILPKRNENMGTTFNFARPQPYFWLLAMFSFWGFVVYMIVKNNHK